MWRKNSEGKPETTGSNAPAPSAVKSQEVPEAAAKEVPRAATSAASTSPVVAAAASNGGVAQNGSTNANSAKNTPLAPAGDSTETGGASTISSGLKIKGEITGTSDLTIDGETQGKVRLVNGRVTVGASGKVDADVEAREIVIHGRVHGNLKASESVRLGSTGHVEGSVLTPRIGIDDGARLRGNVEMIRPGEKSQSSDRGPEKAHAVRAASASAED